MSEYVRWTLAIIVAMLSGFAIICQYGGMIQSLLRQRNDPKAGGYSMVPIIGGVLGMVACLAAPSVAVQRLWWIPPVLDPGCVLLIALVLGNLIWRPTFGRKSPPTPPGP